MDLDALLVVGSVRGLLGEICHRVAGRQVIGFILSGGLLELQTELANLAVEVSALQTRMLGKHRDRAAVELGDAGDVGAFKTVAKLTQRQVEVELEMEFGNVDDRQAGLRTDAKRHVRENEVVAEPGLVVEVGERNIQRGAGSFFPARQSDAGGLGLFVFAGTRNLFVLPELDHLLARLQKLLHRDRLLEEVHCTEARGLHCGFNGAVARHHHDGAPDGVVRIPLLEQGDAVHVGHPDVKENQVEVVLAN